MNVGKWFEVGASRTPKRISENLIVFGTFFCKGRNVNLGKCGVRCCVNIRGDQIRVFGRIWIELEKADVTILNLFKAVLDKNEDSTFQCFSFQTNSALTNIS